MVDVTKEALVARLKTRLDPHALAELEAAVELEGFTAEDLLYALAAMIARAGKNRVGKNRARLIRNATGPQRAVSSVTVHFTIATGAAGYSIATGNVLFQTKSGVRFRTMAAITRLAAEGDGDEVVAVEAEYAGFDAMVTKEEVTEWAIADLNNRDSITWASGIDDAKDEFMLGVRGGSIWFEMDSDPAGGSPGTLDLIGRGKGMLRVDGESDAVYAKRLVIAPEDPVNAISPKGILRAVNEALGGDVATRAEYWEAGFFAFGDSGFGVDAFSGKRFGVIYVPEADDVAPMQALVNEVKAIGYYILVLEAA